MADNTYIKFGIYDIAGSLMEVEEVPVRGHNTHTVKRPVFAVESFAITASLRPDLTTEIGYSNNVQYTKASVGFRKAVRWDFGDGTFIEGQNASHYYSKPGKYKISCTF